MYHFVTISTLDILFKCGDSVPNSYFKSEMGGYSVPWKTIPLVFRFLNMDLGI